MALIKTSLLTKKYMMGTTEVHALRGVDIAIEAGEFVAITGFSGSGKTTLMHLLGCLDQPTSGSYTLDGISVDQATKDNLALLRNQKIGFVFQKFHLLNNLTALDNVALPALFTGIQEEAARDKAADLLRQVNLAERFDHYPYQLSGGQQQRVAMARALINNPSVIFGDEPTGNLDVATGELIMDMLTTLNHEQKVTIIIVTHEPAIAERTKRVLTLVDGLVTSDKVL